MRILRNITFNEAEIAISINIRSLPHETATLTTSTETTEITKTTEIIENAPNANDTDIADINDTNTILENIKNAFLENIIIEPAPVRRSIRHKKTTFKTVETNIIRANTIEANAIKVAEASTTPINEKKSEKEDYLPKAIIAKLITANEDKLTYEKTIVNLKKFQ
jgi:hypothetical protein